MLCIFTTQTSLEGSWEIPVLTVNSKRPKVWLLIIISQHCPRELSAMMKTFYICTVQKVSTWKVASVTEDLILSFILNLNNYMWLVVISVIRFGFNIFGHEYFLGGTLWFMLDHTKWHKCLLVLLSAMWWLTSGLRRWQPDLHCTGPATLSDGFVHLEILPEAVSSPRPTKWWFPTSFYCYFHIYELEFLYQLELFGYPKIHFV